MKKNVRIYNRIFSMIFIALSFMLISQITAHANDFVMEGGVKVPIPDAYTFDRSIDVTGNFSRLSNPTDLFVDKQGNLYVADAGNNRILKFNSSGIAVKQYTNPNGNGFNDPEGVFVGDDGDIYVADTNNSRIVHISQDDQFIEQFVKPQSNLLSSDFKFQPVKIGITSTDLIYVLNKTNYQGFFTIDSLNQFKGYACDTKVGYSIFDTILQIFGSNFQKQMTAKRLPPPASNFCIQGNNVFATITTRGTISGEIAEYTSVGKNLMPEFDYGLSTDDFGKPSLSSFVDLDIDDNGIISAIDQKNCKVLQYDESGDLLDIFGTTGNNRGQFETPVSIAYGLNGSIYVLDSAKDNIQVFYPTAFINDVHAAVKYYSDGKYDAAKQKWLAVLKIDESYTLARQGVAQSEYKAEQYNQALLDFKSVDDKVGYSKAYSAIRHDFYREYFVYIVLGIIILILVLRFVIKRVRKAAYHYFNG